MEGYKNENPEEFGCFEISNGLHIDADNNSTGVVVEFKNKNVTKESKYFKIQVKMEGGKRRWDAESVTCTEGKGMVSIEVEKKTTYVIFWYSHFFFTFSWVKCLVESNCNEIKTISFQYEENIRRGVDHPIHSLFDQFIYQIAHLSINRYFYQL